MKRYAVFTARLALVPMISGTFVVSAGGGASVIEWAHIILGFVTLYLIFGLLLMAFRHQQVRPQAAVALVLALLEAIPHMPRLHATVSPVLFATLAWAGTALPPTRELAPEKSRWIFALPALVLLPIFYGVGYRHQTSGFLPHIGAALLVAGLLTGVCIAQNERNPTNAALRRACTLTITAVVLQIVLGFIAFIIRLLEIQNGFLLAIVRTAHITAAALVLAASVEFAIQYRRKAVEDSSPAIVARAAA
jgi:heme A synthase